MDYALKMNSGVTHLFADLESALGWAKEWEGVNAHYECSDGRVFLYADDEERDADKNGGGERGAVEKVAE